MSGASVNLLRKQINDEYYHGNKSLKTICDRYYWIDEEDIKNVLGVYDLDNEPKVDYGSQHTMTVAMAKDWNDVCRKLNPKAWEGR